MWYCEDCGEKFSEPDYYEEQEEYDNGVNGAWNVACCPCCGSADVVEGFYINEEEGEEE
jgi:hypothetical protein